MIDAYGVAYPQTKLPTARTHCEHDEKSSANSTHSDPKAEFQSSFVSPESRVKRANSTMSSKSNSFN